MSRLTTIEIQKEECSFSAGHFTIFSATEREHLHGHNYYVSLALQTIVEHNGLTFDYRHFKQKLLGLCELLDRHLLLPKNSPYLTLEEQEDYWIAHFNQQKMPFLKNDVVVLPVKNITIEELAVWFLENILKNQAEIDKYKISKVIVKVYNGPGQAGKVEWCKSFYNK
ncbi:MAG: 6-pyruvoyl tetrahydrobiopterin synthase [Gammaproteobacteria bacterium RIFCSPHIGHO2_12_FULL_38_14]|nr:MAG: 6-pyruvoyl tetrahydrobiopterin synthase [Gammaproteobacteria bacterium RIFCSPHIGHO2_12_FULL_38_14]